MNRNRNAPAVKTASRPTRRARRRGDRRPRPPARWAAITLGATLLVVPIGCREKPPAPDDTLRATAARGPLSVSLTVRPKEVWLADPVEIRLEARAPENYALRLPDDDAFGDLPVRVAERPDPRPAPEGGRLWRRVYVFEPLAAGRVQVPALTVAYAPTQAEEGTSTQPAAAWRELETEPLTVEVRSALTTQDTMLQPRDIAGPLVPGWTVAEVLRAAWWPAALAAVAAAVAWLWWRRRRGRRREPPPVLPEVWALQALAALEREDWLGTGRVREYYYRLSEVVRAYIEKKFALAAPEMTTAEFLQALARDRSALPYDADRLRAFLEACDAVKYAALRPGRKDAAEALAMARAFVHTTAAAASAAQATPESGGPATPGGQAA